MSTTLTIAGSTINVPAARVVLDRLTLSLDRPDEFEFHEEVADFPGTYRPEQRVTLADGSTTLFDGWIFSRHPDGFGRGPTRVGYRCLGLSYGASLVAVTASDSTGTIRFNLPVTDPLYVATQAGKSVGDIISECLSLHSSQLTAMGITTDATTTAQLAALTVVSPDPVYIQGNSLWTQLLQLLQQWYGSRYALYITPAGLVRCYDTTSLTAETITLDSDPAILESMTEDTAECYTQVVLRGWANTEPAYLSLSQGTLIGEAVSGGGWTPTEQGLWTVSDFLFPGAGYDQGSITSMTSTTVTVQSDNATTTWPLNYWSGIQGQVYLIDPVATGITQQESRPITANSALTAGGTSTLTLAAALSNSGYTRYYARGIPPGQSEVWRKYTIKSTYIAQHLTEMFNRAIPWAPGQLGVAWVNSPQAVICYTTAGLKTQVAANFEVVPYDGTTDGYILFYQPTVTVNNSQQALQKGGTAVTAPDDIEVVVPYSRGALSVTSPSGGGHSGTAFTRFGVQRTLYRDYPDWLDAANSSAMQALADAILATVSNAVQEGHISYHGKYSTALPTGSWPIAVNIARATGTTGYESMAAPVRTVVLEWPQEGGSTWITHLSFSTRRQMYSGDRLYVHPMYTGGGALGGFSGEAMQAGVGFSGVVNPAQAASAAMGQAAGQATGAMGEAAGQASSALGESAGLASSTSSQQRDTLSDLARQSVEDILS
jgi:hypothetical protein